MNKIKFLEHIEEIERFTRLSRSSNIGQRILLKHRSDSKFYEKLTKELENDIY